MGALQLGFFTEVPTKEGYVYDPISGKEVKARDERVQAKLVFAQKLISEYGYVKDQIQTFPEYWIKKGSLKIGPADIVVFKDTNKTFDNIFIIVETKSKNRKDGEEQLKSYVAPTPAEGAVWFNGVDIAYFRVIRKPPAYTPEFVSWRNIPKKGESWDDIGKSKTVTDLIPATNLKAIFRIIYKYLYTNSNLPRAERLSSEMVRLIFCKLHDEIHNPNNLQFKAGVTESDSEIATRIKQLFEELRDQYYGDIFGKYEQCLLDDKSIAYVVNELQNYSLLRTDKDAVGDAFEVFIGPALRGEKGQFFTPRNIIKLCVEIIDPEPSMKIIDPACGSGGFLITALEHVWKKLEAGLQHLSKEHIGTIKAQIASTNFYGIDKEFDLAKITKAYMAIVGDGRGNVFCADSLIDFKEWPPEIQEKIKPAAFDILLTNPPFGSKIPITDKTVLSQYELAHTWSKDQADQWTPTPELKQKEVPQLLFIERCLHFLKDGGKMAIILPETYLHAKDSQYILQFLLRWKILHVIDLSHDTFRPDNNAKTVVVILQKSKPSPKDEVFFSIATTVGHDHTGRTLYKIDPNTNKRTNEVDDDIPRIISAFNRYRATRQLSHNPLLFCRPRSQLNPEVLVARYYWRPYLSDLYEYASQNNCELIPMGELHKKGIIEVYEGHGSPDAIYKGRGTIPYVRVADIVNLEVYKNPTALIPKDIYLQLKGQGVDLQVADLLFVRRGSYRIGSVALVSPFDTKVLLTKEILVFRVANRDNEWDITPYYLVYLLTHQLVQKQIPDKVLIETTLPNIADRWKELLLPVAKDKLMRQAISEEIQSAFKLKWEATAKIQKYLSQSL